MATNFFKFGFEGQEDREYIEYLESIISLMPGHVYWLDRNNVYLGCNELQAEFFELDSPKAVVGRTNADFLKDKDIEMINGINRKVMDSGLTHSVEEEVVVQGQKRTYLSKKTPVFDRKKEIVGLVGISFDITEQKKTEAIMREEKSNKLMRFLNEILESVNFETGVFPLLRDKFHLKTIVEDVVALNREKAIEKQLDLEFEFDETLPSYLIGDPVRIYRIVFELLSNAVKFTSQGKVRVLITLAKKEKRDVVIKMVVEDTGAGIPKEKQSEIFVCLNRPSISSERIEQSVGLGLPVVRQFVTDLEGEIYVESQDSGTTFFCFLPLKEALLNDSFGEETYTQPDVSFLRKDEI